MFGTFSSLHRTAETQAEVCHLRREQVTGETLKALSLLPGVWGQAGVSESAGGVCDH